MNHLDKDKHEKQQKDDVHSIVLIFLHPHRINDLKNWLVSMERVTELNILLLVSNRTVDQLEPLIATKHQFAWKNIEADELDISEPLATSSLGLLWHELKRSYVSFKSRYRVTYQLLANHTDAVVVTYDDRMQSILPILKASYALDIPVFLPAILTTQPDIQATTANTLKPKRKIETCIAWLAKKIFPQHVSQEGRLFYNALAYLVLLWFKSVPNHPWVKGTLRYTTKLGVESKLAHQKLVVAGADPEKLTITGMAVYDLMDFSRQASNSELLLCALPQYAEHGAMNFEQAQPIIEEILTAFKAFAGQVVISLHPRMAPEMYRPIVEKHGFTCVVGNIDEWLNKASLFFAASSSTTIYSALIIGVPSVALNHIPPGSNIFKDFVSLQYIEKNAEIEIQSIIQQPKPDWQALIQKDQELLSSEVVSDGNCGARNLQIIKQLTK